MPGARRHPELLPGTQRSASWARRWPARRIWTRSVAPDERAGPHERAWFLRTREWRYVFAGRDGRESLYRIEEDPGEAHDLAGAHPDVLARLRRALLAEIDAMEGEAALESR